MISYVAPAKPHTDKLVQIGADRPIKTLAAYMAVAKPGTEVQFARGQEFDLLNGWTPPPQTVLSTYGDPAALSPRIRVQYDGKFTAAALGLNNPDQWVEGVTVTRHPSSTGLINAITIKGDRVVIRGNTTGPGFQHGIKVAENDDAKDVWIEKNILDFALDYDVFFDGMKGGCTNVYCNYNVFSGVSSTAPGGGNHSGRFYGLNNALFQFNWWGPTGKGSKATLNIRGANNAAWIEDTFIGRPVEGSGNGTGPLEIEPAGFVKDVTLLRCKLWNSNNFNINPGTENLVIDGCEIHTLRYDCFTATHYATAGFKSPNATLRNVKAWGPGKLIGGDLSRITLEPNNVMIPA